MRTVWSFHTYGSFVFGRHAVRQVGDVARGLRVTKALVVTDPVLIQAGLVEPVHASLTEAGVAVELFSEGEPEPSMRVAEKLIEVGRQVEPDALVAVGGGSNMDLAKAAAIVLRHGWYLRDFLGDSKVPGPVLPVICVPTTAGTGSEVSAAAVVTDTENQLKVGILSNYLRPAAAIVDPMLTVPCPPKVTADSGIDALTHAVEAYTAVDNENFSLPHGEVSVYQGRHPLGNILAEKAIGLIGQYLRRAVANGNDLEAREGMALGASLAGMAFSNIGVAIVHALEYPLGAAVHCSHGAGNGLLLPYVMRFNLPARIPQFAAIARLLGEDTSGMSETEAAERAVVAVEKLRDDIGVPGRLRDLGVRDEQLRPLAEKAFGIKRMLRLNPRPATAEDLERILRTAF